MSSESAYIVKLKPVAALLSRGDYFLMFLGFAYLGIYSVEVLVNPPADVRAALETGGWVIYGIFILDLVARIIIWIPKLATLGGWLEFFRENWLAIIAAALPAFRSFRVLRVLLVLRGVSPYLESRMAKVAMVTGVALPLIIYTASLSVLEAERGMPGARIETFADALWWSMVTVTTVGYGDTFPVTPDGRLVGTFLIFAGIGLFSTVTALIASWVLKEGKFSN